MRDLLLVARFMESLREEEKEFTDKDDAGHEKQIVSRTVLA
jgi:hypothetical protein